MYTDSKLKAKFFKILYKHMRTISFIAEFQKRFAVYEYFAVHTLFLKDKMYLNY